jgi:hypothetical protein
MHMTICFLWRFHCRLWVAMQSECMGHVSLCDESSRNTYNMFSLHRVLLYCICVHDPKKNYISFMSYKYLRNVLGTVQDCIATCLLVVCRYERWSQLSAINSLYVPSFSKLRIILFKQQNTSIMSTLSSHLPQSQIYLQFYVHVLGTA